VSLTLPPLGLASLPYLAGLTTGLAVGWVLGIKRLPPSRPLATALRIIRHPPKKTTGAKTKTSKSENPRYKIFQNSLPKADIVFLGDSLTERGNFHEYFDTRYRIYNRGVSGDSTLDVIQRLSDIKRLRAPQIFMMIGINDIYNQGRSPEDVVDNIKHITRELQDSGSDVYIQEIIQCSAATCSESVNKVEVANQLIRRSFAADFIVPLGELSKPDGLASIYTHDGIHLNANGYQLWIKKLKPYIEREIY
jgi:lysophospholipase L1-like esterase